MGYKSSFTRQIDNNSIILILFRTKYSSVKGIHFQSGVHPSIDDAVVLKMMSPSLWEILFNGFTVHILAAISHNFESVGHFSTYLTVMADCLQNVMAKIFQNFEQIKLIKWIHVCRGNEYSMINYKVCRKNMHVI